jgi:hypothetical protein
VECAHTAPYYFFGKDDTFALDCAIPFGLNSRQMTAWMYEGNGMKLFREFYEGYNIVNFPMGNTGAQMGGWYRKEIKTLNDIKGLKMRIGGFAGKVLTTMGGVPQNIPGGEIYQALEKGTIDATEWVGPYDDQKLGFNKVAKNYYYPGWWEGGPQLSLYVNNKAFAALSPENKAIVECAAAIAHTTMQAKYDALNPGALKQLVAAGTKVLAFPTPRSRIPWSSTPTSAPRTRSGRRSTPTTRPSARTRTSGSVSPKPSSTATCSRPSCNRHRHPAKSPALAGFFARAGPTARRCAASTSVVLQFPWHRFDRLCVFPGVRLPFGEIPCHSC